MHHGSIDHPPPIKKKAAGIILYTYMYRQQEYNYFADTTKNKNQKKKNNPKITKNPQKTKTRKTKNHQTINSSHRRPIRLSY